jgi:DNA-binding response OmpR family regulator
MNLEETAQRCGADGFICKPFDMNELLQQVKTYLK